MKLKKQLIEFGLNPKEWNIVIKYISGKLIGQIINKEDPEIKFSGFCKIEHSDHGAYIDWHGLHLCL